MEVDGRYFEVDGEVKRVLDILSKSNSYREAAFLYEKETNEIYTEKEFSYYGTEIIKKFNLDKKEKSFLLVEKLIISPKMASKLSIAIQWLFQPYFFWISFLSLTIFALYLNFIYRDEVHLDSLDVKIIPFFIWYSITIIFHELGHIAACKRFTGNNGGLGFGIYIIYPVFFSDISSIWHATKQEKIIANLAGIYMQMWFVPLFFLYSILSGDHFFLDFSKLLVFICFIQILPFVRSDGYWLLSDILNLPNLLSKSQEQIRAFLKAPASFFKTSSKADVATLSYGLVNATFLLSFAYYQLSFNYEALFSFPSYLWKFLSQIFYGNLNELQFETRYITVIVFYYLLYSYARLLFKYLCTYTRNNTLN